MGENDYVDHGYLKFKIQKCVHVAGRGHMIHANDMSGCEKLRLVIGPAVISPSPVLALARHVPRGRQVCRVELDALVRQQNGLHAAHAHEALTLVAAKLVHGLGLEGGMNDTVLLRHREPRERLLSLEKSTQGLL